MVSTLISAPGNVAKTLVLTMTFLANYLQVHRNLIGFPIDCMIVANHVFATDCLLHYIILMHALGVGM